MYDRQQNVLHAIVTPSLEMVICRSAIGATKLVEYFGQDIF